MRRGGINVNLGQGGARDFADKTLKRIRKLKRAVAIELFKSVILDSPVGNPEDWKVNAGKNGDDDGSNNFYIPEGYVGGRLRANWRFSEGSADTTTTDDVDGTGTATVKAMTDAVRKADPDADFYLSNTLPYAHRIEYDGWSHTKAPQGMLRKNMARVRPLVSAKLAEIKRDIS